jgi:hypothetical protein
MPAICMRFRQVVSSGLSANAIRFATATSFGHRVKINVTGDELNTIFKWKREANTSLPVVQLVETTDGHVSTGGKFHLRQLIGTSIINNGFDDLDKKVNGLDFSSAALNNLELINPAVRATPSTATMNDLVMAYVLFRCFGKSEYNGAGEIYNLDDAYNMVDGDAVISAIGEKFYDNPDEITNFLREQLTKDPSRYLNSTATASNITALFDRNMTDEASESTGNMVWAVGDVIEIPVRLVFRAPVSVASISDDTLYTSGADQSDDTTQKQVIAGELSTWDPAGTVVPAAGNVLAFRLQLTVTAVPTTQ